jgi:hypothetical protein
MKSLAQLPPGGMSGRKLIIDNSMGSTEAAVVSVLGAAVVSVLGAAVVSVLGAAVVSVLGAAVVVVSSSPQPKTRKDRVRTRTRLMPNSASFFERTPFQSPGVKSIQ